MFQRVEVKGFRGIDGLRLDDLKRVNLILGKNGAGKTSLLEAVFQLAGGHPQLGMRVNSWRGIAPETESTALFYRWLFTQFPTQATTIEIKGTLGQRRVRRLQLYSREKPSSLIEIDGASSGANGLAGTQELAASDEIDLEISEGGEHAVLRAQVVRTVKENEVSHGVRFDAAEPEKWLIPAVLLHMGVIGGGREDVARVEKLVQLGQLQTVLKALRPIQDEISDMRTLGDGPNRGIWVQIGGAALMPVGLLGGGFQRLLSMVVAAADARGGVLLVDEVDTGLHYTVLGDVLAHLVDLSKTHDYQVFATTHSWDCLAALGGLGPDFAKDVAVYRIDKTDGGAESVRYDYDMLQEAVRSRLEVR
ncbi:MAG: AAA family ATPase [Armatimonadetes bacterium]|nr:AAA family ATPase [Armatimonadota bacterium]